MLNTNKNMNFLLSAYTVAFLNMHIQFVFPCDVINRCICPIMDPGTGQKGVASQFGCAMHMQ